MAIQPGLSVDWKRLRTVRGVGTRVPSQIKALSGNPEERQLAFGALVDSLAVDGTVSDAAPPAIPLLCNALANGKDGGYLAAWLIGEAVTAGHMRLLLDPQAPVAGPVAAARDAASSCKDALLSVLAGGDAPARAGSAFALAWIPALADDVRTAVRRQLRVETSDPVKASLLLCLGVLAQPGNDSTDDKRIVIEELARALSPAVSGPAVLSLMLLGAGVVKDAGRSLTTFLADPPDPQTMPWARGDPDRLVVAIARRLALEIPVARAVAAELDPTAPVPAWQRPTSVLLDLGGFKDHWQIGDVALREDLSADQRFLAEALARKDGLQGWPARLPFGWGLPASGRVRRRWLGVTPPGPMEKLIPFEADGARHSWPVWKVWKASYENGQPQEVLPGVVATHLSPDEALEALAEVGMSAYGLAFPRRGDPPAEAIAQVADRAGPESVDWARRLADEILTLIAEQAVAELGGALGASTETMVAICLALIRGGARIELKWNGLVPWQPTAVARTILEALPSEQREECVWQRLRIFEAPSSAGGVAAVLPLLDLVPSRRVASVLVAKLRNPQARSMLAGGGLDPEACLSKVREIAETAPEVAAALK